MNKKTNSSVETMHPLQRQENHHLKQRKVLFDFTNTPHYWIYDNAFATHLINAVHLILPVGERWMCRTFNEALPYVQDEKLREDVAGFIAQEAHHATAHSVAQTYLRQHNYDIDPLLKQIEIAFKQLGSAQPLGLKLPESIAQQWLVIRVGIAASIEHFTSMLGTWCLEEQPWQQDKADAMMSDLFTWHLAEEVEHRSVAFDLYIYLCGEEHRAWAYLQRQAIMAAVAPIFIKLLHHCFKALAREDKKLNTKVKLGFFSVAHRSVTENAQSKQVPSLLNIVASLRRWVRPQYHPYFEGDTNKALAVIANSPAVQKLNASAAGP